MNTDNMSILGYTIDYGPYGWLEGYNPGWTPNTTDAEHKRYRFGNQPNISLWNLTQLANAIYPLIKEAEPLQEILNNYQINFETEYHTMMLSKLGLYNSKKIERTFVTKLTGLFEEADVDYTIFFRLISTNQSNDFANFQSILLKSSYASSDRLESLKSKWENWFNSYEVYRNLEGENLDWLGSLTEELPKTAIWSPTMGFSSVDKEILSKCETAINALADSGVEIIEKETIRFLFAFFLYTYSK